MVDDSSFGYVNGSKNLVSRGVWKGKDVEAYLEPEYGLIVYFTETHKEVDCNTHELTELLNNLLL